MTDWDRYRKCPACFAPLGKPCWDVTGSLIHGRPYAEVEAVASVAHGPHTPRKLRTGYARGEQ